MGLNMVYIYILLYILCMAEEKRGKKDVAEATQLHNFVPLQVGGRERKI